jgi:ribulose-5-phosphate 4-epimerase/fuculose-1-phosphate aldolase
MTTSAKVVPLGNTDESQLRIDLAAALRLAAYYNWHEGVANHFSAAVSPDGKKVPHEPALEAFLDGQGQRNAAHRRR